MACITIGLVMRLLCTFLLVHFGGFNLKEKLFIAVAWMPKATVQVGVCNRVMGDVKEMMDTLIYEGVAACTS